MPEVIQHADENDKIELPERFDVVHAEFAKLDRLLEPMRQEASLSEDMRHDIRSDDASGVPLLHFKRKESGIATNVQHRLPREIVRNKRFQEPPAAGHIQLVSGIRRHFRSELDVMVPG